MLPSCGRAAISNGIGGRTFPRLLWRLCFLTKTSLCNGRLPPGAKGNGCERPNWHHFLGGAERASSLAGKNKAWITCTPLRPPPSLPGTGRLSMSLLRCLRITIILSRLVETLLTPPTLNNCKPYLARHRLRDTTTAIICGTGFDCPMACAQGQLPVEVGNAASMPLLPRHARLGACRRTAD